jgi:glucose-6-phosphate 1-dehydrogenase
MTFKDFLKELVISKLATVTLRHLSLSVALYIHTCMYVCMYTTFGVSAVLMFGNFHQGTGEVNRIFYLSVPHEIVPEVSSCLSKNAQSKAGWTRLIVEKPFGTDTESSEMLTDGLLKHLDESQIYRFVMKKSLLFILILIPAI